MSDAKTANACVDSHCTGASHRKDQGVPLVTELRAFLGPHPYSPPQRNVCGTHMQRRDVVIRARNARIGAGPLVLGHRVVDVLALALDEVRLRAVSILDGVRLQAHLLTVWQYTVRMMCLSFSLPKQTGFSSFSMPVPAHLEGTWNGDRSVGKDICLASRKESCSLTARYAARTSRANPKLGRSRSPT